MIGELVTLLVSMSVLAFLVALVTCALGLRRRAIRRGLSWAEVLSQWWTWTELSAWSLAVGSGLGVLIAGWPQPEVQCKAAVRGKVGACRLGQRPHSHHSRTSGVWRAFLVLVWVVAIFLVPYQVQPVSARGIEYDVYLDGHEDGYDDFDLSDVRLATNSAAASTQTEAPSVYTDDAGRYRFESMPKGTHKVTIDLSTLPSHLRPPEGEVSPVLWLTPGMEQTSEAVSTGVRFTAAYDRASGDISGLVFLDLDGDGRLGPNDPGIPGVRVIDPTVYQYYVPFNDENLWTLFDDKNTGLPGAQLCHAGGNPVAGTLDSSIFLVASADGTVYYYDHWEDGYDADPLVPGPTTESGVLNAGGVQLFQDNVDPAQVPDPAVFFYDGRDRITVAGLRASVVRLAFPSTPGEVLAGAWEVPEVGDWGTSFVTTVGEDLDFNGGDVDDHDFTGLEVMAALPGTEVYYNGALLGVLGPGGTLFVDGANDGPFGGGVDSTDIITATGPIQVQMLTGACGARYSAHGYTLRPVEEWGRRYWAPVPGFSCGGDVADTDIYLHNHNAGPINVTVESDQGTAVVPIPPHTTVSLLEYVTSVYGWADVSTGSSGIHLFSADPFGGLAVIDSSSNGLGSSSQRDWGYTLVCESALSSQAVVGYAPGNNADPPTDNGNSAFVTAVTDNTLLHVDLDRDGTPDPFDMNGDGDALDNNVFGVAAWDEPLSAAGIPLQAGQTTRVGDPLDRNLQGALIYSIDYAHKISVAWGQDPCRAGIGTPYLDLGYTVLPIPIPSLSKEDALAIDADLSGDVTPGDTLTYTLVLINNGLGSMDNVVLTDSLPYTYTDFVVGSLQVTTPPSVGVIEYSNDGTTFGVPPNPDIQAFRIQWPIIGPGQVVTITFLVRLYTDIPPTVTEISNQAVVSSDSTDPTPSDDPEDPFDPDTDTPVAHPGVVLLHLDKRVSPTGVVSPGEILTYTLCYSNSGSIAATNVVITDFVPLDTTYITGSATAPNGETIEYYNGTAWDVVEPPAIQVEGLRWLTDTLVPSSTYCVQFRVQLDVTIANAGALWMLAGEGKEGNAETPTLPPEATLTATVAELPTEEPTARDTSVPVPTEIETPTSVLPEVPAEEPTAIEVPTEALTEEPTPTANKASGGGLILAARSWLGSIVVSLSEPLLAVRGASMAQEASPTPTEAPTPTANPAEGPTEAPTEEPMPTMNPTEATTETLTLEPTEAPPDAATLGPTETIMPTETPTTAVTTTNTPTASPTATQVLTETPTVAPSETAETTPSPSATATPAATPIVTSTSTPTAMPTTPLTLTVTTIPEVTSVPLTVTPPVTTIPAALQEIAIGALQASSITNTATIDSDETYPVTDTVTNNLCPQSIGDRVWHDANRDGVQDVGEVGIPGITVVLFRGDIQVAETETGADGYYVFENLDLGTYIVDVHQGDPDMPVGYFLTTGNEPLEVRLGLCEQYVDADFGYAVPVWPLGALGDYVWYDKDWGRDQDPDEEGLKEITLWLYRDLDENGEIGPGDVLSGTTETDFYGYYWFNHLPAGWYIVDVDEKDPDLPEDLRVAAAAGGVPEIGSLVLTTDDLLPVIIGDGRWYYLDADFGFAGISPTPVPEPPDEPEPSGPEPPAPPPPAPPPAISATLTPTLEVLTVEKLPETGGFPDWFMVVLGVPIIIGVAGLLNLAWLEVRGRRGDKKGS